MALKKAAARARKETAVARAEDEIARKRAFVERFGAKNTKATQAKSKQKMLDRLTGKDAVSARQLSLETGLRLRRRSLSRSALTSCSRLLRRLQIPSSSPSS